MLAHIAKAAAVVIPIAAKGLVNAVRVIRLFRGGTEPEIVIKLGRHGLRSEVGAAAPLILFPIKAGRPADSDFERPTQKSGLHQFLDGFHWNPHAIEIAFEPEPGIEPENPFVFRNRGLHRFTLGNSPAHGLLAPDILAGFSGRDGNQRVPVWRGRDMHDVDVFAGKNFAEILVTFPSSPPALIAAWRCCSSTSQTASSLQAVLMDLTWPI